MLERDQAAIHGAAILPAQFVEFNKAIRKAGSIPLHYYGQQLDLLHKSTNADFQTKADIETEKAIIVAIESIFPDYNILGEEHGEFQKNSDYTFVIDPLDGTNNFVLGVPIFTTSVALMKGKEIIYGVIYNPITQDIYYALKGQGAFLNGQKIAVNTEDRNTHLTVSYFCNYTTPKERAMRFHSRLYDFGVKRSLNLWAPAFCYCSLACGKIDAIINDKIELYDFAAGKLIAMEAGALATDFSGNELIDDTVDTFIISNGSSMHALLAEHLLAMMDP